MRSTHVSRTIATRPEPIFDVLADHARYDRFRGIHGSELLKDGDPPPNGLGAMRRIKAWPATFEEEITHFERPTRLDYLIVRLNIPFEHQGGSIRLSPADGATRVDWRSAYAVPTPLIGGLQERVWDVILRRGFRRVLEDVDRIVS
jgi:Polyketide cyclase / dehydrase and lipid transport